MPSQRGTLHPDAIRFFLDSFTLSGQPQQADTPE